MLEGLPNDIFYQFISFYVHTIKDVYSLLLTSKELYRLCDNEDIWNMVFKKTLAYKYYRDERMNHRIQEINKLIINDKYTKCLLMIENKHEAVFDIYSFTYSPSENKYNDVNHYTIEPGYNIQIETYMYSVWFIVPIKSWYIGNGYLKQSKIVRVWDNPLLSRLIDRKTFGNNWSHRLYYVQLTIPEEKNYIPNFYKNMYALRKTHF
tara:strand:+ start:161 stop:781 length:621 start_codon:yes stop_codon:yes gene_type:complete